MMMNTEGWAGWGSTIASLMFLWAVVRQYFPAHFDTYLSKFSAKLVAFFYPYVEITFSEYVGNLLNRSEAYSAIEAYLTTSCSDRAMRLKAELGRDTRKVELSMDDYEEITDEFHGAKLWWFSSKTTKMQTTISFYPVSDEKRCYRLTFHRRHRKLINDTYLPYVMEQGKAIGIKKRQRKLYTNSSSYDYEEHRKLAWSHVPFEHPATFETLAMETDRKIEIMKDLATFTQRKEYYAKIGKPWKRGYLLYGPPGTGKSTMIAAMANFLDYDVYDLELTAVKNNSTLRKLLIETTNKSIIVIEDIDCSLDLSGKRKPGERKEQVEEKVGPKMEDKEDSKVTLSGLLNFIDGLWSACGEERLIVFTTNHLNKLDPALIRRGRMDKHVELSYCGFQGFKVLAKNYLGVDSHPLFERIRLLLEEKKMAPADVAENLLVGDEDVGNCLENLVEVLQQCKGKDEEEEKEVDEGGEQKGKDEEEEKEADGGGEGKKEGVE